MGRSVTVTNYARALLVAGLALAAAVQVVRSAAVQHFVSTRPDQASLIWPDHPSVLLAMAMASIGKSAKVGRAPTEDSLAQTRLAAVRSPLAIEPYLIQGAMAQSEAEPRRAEQLFAEASRRDPRSAAARFFLSQLYLSSNRPDEGLRHAAVLARLVSGGSAALVPALAAYAGSPGAVPALRKMFARDPALRDAVLSKLASDAHNYDLILALGRESIGANGLEPAGWQTQLLASLVSRGDYVRARQLWMRTSGLVTVPVGLFNPHFARLPAPAPFNWTFGAGDFGFAEPTEKASLHVTYYGRADGQFASQTLLLPPGTYQLRMRVVRASDRDHDSRLAWNVTCNKGGRVLLNLPLGAEKGRAYPVAGQFRVPADCDSQTIKLVAKMGEELSSEEATISDFQLVRLVK